MPSVSVAMCTFNGAKFLPQQFESLLRQSRLPDEVVICDDGSSDGTQDAVLEFRRRAPFAVTFVRNDERVGYRANFMKAVGLCSGDLVAFCDQDDVWHPNKLETGAEPFADDDVLLTYHKVKLIDGGGAYLRDYDDRAPPTPRVPPLTLNPFAHGLGFTQMLRRSLCAGDDLWPRTIDHSHPDSPLAHDQFYFFIAAAVGAIVYIDEALADYRQHGANVYGVKDQGGGRQTLQDRLLAMSDNYSRCAKSCQSRAAVLDGVAPRLAAPFGARASLGARTYADLAGMFRIRSDMYAQRSFAKKVTTIMQLHNHRGYRSNRPWSFGLRALLKDSVYSVF